MAGRPHRPIWLGPSESLGVASSGLPAGSASTPPPSRPFFRWESAEEGEACRLD